MIAVDTNVLVAYQRSEYVHHKRAVEVITILAEGHSACVCNRVFGKI